LQLKYSTIEKMGREGGGGGGGEGRGGEGDDYNCFCR